MSKFLCCFLLLVISTCDAASFADPAQDVEALVDRVIERRALMHDVAAWKWHKQRPIADPVREDELRADVRGKAERLGLQPDAVVAFFDLQMRWARELQQDAFEQFELQAPDAAAVRDLTGEVRPALDRIGADLLLRLYLIAPHLQSAEFSAHLESAIRARVGPSLSHAETDELTSAIRAIRRADNDGTERIHASGVLRVGLTGDYAPFSLEQNGQLSGADVELAGELARSLNVQVRFVRTTWSTLMADLQAGHFDVAAGGISITPDRAAIARFTPPYHVGGKTPIVRCGDEARYDTIAEINTPDVRVVVNRGGTNERFARDQLRNAQLRMVEDNRTVFDEIAAGRADVMVTDDVEVELQVRKGKGLCRATRNTFTRAEKAWMLPVDEQFEETLNAWMAAAIRSGKVSRALEQAM